MTCTQAEPMNKSTERRGEQPARRHCDSRQPIRSAVAAPLRHACNYDALQYEPSQPYIILTTCAYILLPQQAEDTPPRTI